MSIIICRENVETMPVDLYISTKSEVSWCDEVTVLVNVFVLSSFQEFTFNYSWVLLCWLKDWKSVVGQEEWNNKSSVNIFWDSSVESGCESENLFVIVYILEEVSLWLFRQQFVDVSEGVCFISKSVMGWDLKWLGFSRLGVFNSAQVEELVVLWFIEALSEFIDSGDSELSAEGINCTTWFYLITG